MNHQQEMETPEYRLSYGAYSAWSDAVQLRDEIADCSDLSTLDRAAQDIERARELLAERLSEIQARSTALSSTTLFARVA